MLAILVAVAIVVVPGPATAGDQPFPIAIEVGRRSFALPFRDVLGTHGGSPTIAAGTEYRYVEGYAGSLLQTVRLGLSTSSTLGSGISLATDLAYRYTAPFGVFGEASVGLGYLHTFHPRPIYRQSGAGEYRRVADYGKPTARASFALGGGYDCARAIRLPLALFARYEWLVQSPYFETIPIAPQAVLSVGVRLSWREL